MLGVLALGFMVAAGDICLAQPGGDGEGEGRRQRQRGQFGGPGGGRGGFGGGRQGPNFDEMYDRIAKELQLDESQLSQLEEIKTAQRERMNAMRERMEAIREAERAGDETTAQQLRDEFRQEREQSGGGGFRGDPFSAIEPILTEAQRGQLATVRQQFREEREQEMRQRVDGRFEQIAEELQLNDDQRVALDEIKAAQIQRMEEMRDRWGEVRQAYDSGNTALGDQLREQMVSEMRQTGGPRGFINDAIAQLDPVLTDEQREIAADMREEDGRGGRRGGRDRGERRGEFQQDEASDEVSPAALPQALGMTEQQQASYSTMLAGHQQQTAALNGQMAQIREQIASARQSGDGAAVERYTAQLANLEAQAAQQDDAFYSQVGNILTADQQAKLAGLRSDQEASKDLRDAPADLRVVIKAAMKLKLDPGQREQLKSMVKEVKNDIREARATDRKNRDRERLAEKALANNYRNRINGILTAEQSQKFSTLLEEMTPKRRNRREI